MLNPSQFGEWKSLGTDNPAAYQVSLALHRHPTSDTTSPTRRQNLTGRKTMLGRKKPPTQRLVNNYKPYQPSAN